MRIRLINLIDEIKYRFFFKVHKTLRDDICPTCKEKLGIHNHCRERACIAQMFLGFMNTKKWKIVSGAIEIEDVKRCPAK